MGKKDKTEETPPESVVEAAQEGIPFVGDITRYLFGEAPDAIRKDPKVVAAYLGAEDDTVAQTGDAA